MITRTIFAKQTFYLLDHNVIWCKIHVIYGFFTTETTILPQPWVGLSITKVPVNHLENELKVWKNSMLFINSLVWQIANINPFFNTFTDLFFDFSNNQGTFLTPG